MAHPELGNPEADREEAASFLVCRTEGRLCAVPLALVRERMRPLPTESIAGAPAYVLGAALIRDALTPVVDAAALLGTRGAGQPKRFVTLDLGAHTVGLAVDEVLGLRMLPHKLANEIPPLLRDCESGVVSHLGALDAQLLVTLQHSRLIPDSVWQSLEGRSTAT